MSRDSVARRISAEERRARLGRRHHLAPACRAADVVDVGREAVLAVETEAARLASWIGNVRVTPRFRTPLERELSAQKR